MKILTTVVARILFSLPFFVFGALHFAAADSMAQALPSFLPGGIVWIYLTGLGLLAGAVSLWIQKWTKEALFGISFFLLATIAMVHVPGVSNPDPMMQQMSMSGLFKDLGLLGGALAYLGIYTNKQ